MIPDVSIFVKGLSVEPSGSCLMFEGPMLYTKPSDGQQAEFDRVRVFVHGTRADMQAFAELILANLPSE